MRVKYIGEKETLAFRRDRAYLVLSIEKGWYRVLTELGEDYLFHPSKFEIIEDENGAA